MSGHTTTPTLASPLDLNLKMPLLTECRVPSTGHFKQRLTQGIEGEVGIEREMKNGPSDDNGFVGAKESFPGAED